MEDAHRKVSDQIISDEKPPRFKLNVGSYAIQGRRNSMEDRHTIVENVRKEDPSVEGSLFAVFDGHGGENTASYACANILEIFLSEMKKQRESYTFSIMPMVMECTFGKIDQNVITDHARLGNSGTTAAVLYVNDNILYSANVGDTEIMLGRKPGVKTPFEILSTIHKPIDESECTRITNAGGYVLGNRVNGYLAISRAIGDAQFKQPRTKQDLVSCVPYTKELRLGPDDDFIIIACDGLWEHYNYKTLYDDVQKFRRLKPREMAKKLVKTAYNGGSGDNISVIFISLERQK